jgi:hypothetical protein
LLGLGWLGRLLGLGGDGSAAEAEDRPDAPESAHDAPAPAHGSSMPPPPDVKADLDAAQARLKQTIPPPEDGTGGA